MTRQSTTGALPGTGPTVHHQIPAGSSPPSGSGDSPQARRPAVEHGGARGAPCPRPRRAPFDDLPPHLVTVAIGGWARQSRPAPTMTGSARWCCRSSMRANPRLPGR